jgi:ABC-type Mn2+/Zn2+ transport system permease subunit
VFTREAAVGVSGSAYFLGKVLADVPFLILAIFMFTTPVVAIAPWRSPVEKLYAVFLTYAAFVNVFGYVLSFLYNSPDDATLVGVVAVILLNLFDGFVPKLGDKPIGPLFFSYYLSRAIAAVEVYYGQNIKNIDTFNSIVGSAWKNPSFGKDLWVLLIITVGTMAIAYALFLYANRKYVRLF